MMSGGEFVDPVLSQVMVCRHHLNFTQLEIEYFVIKPENIAKMILGLVDIPLTTALLYQLIMELQSNSINIAIVNHNQHTTCFYCSALFCNVSNDCIVHCEIQFLG